MLTIILWKYFKLKNVDRSISFPLVFFGGALLSTNAWLLTLPCHSYQVQGMHSDVAALSKASIWREAARIMNEEGVRAFWKGNMVTIAHRLPYTSVNFYAYERYKNVSAGVVWVILMSCQSRSFIIWSFIISCIAWYQFVDPFLFCSCCIRFLGKIVGVIWVQMFVCTL